jgi:hypothetical protein
LGFVVLYLPRVLTRRTGNLLRHGTPVPSALSELLRRLSGDVSSEVRSFAARASLEASVDTPPEKKYGKERLERVALFSRPPILSESSTTNNEESGNSAMGREIINSTDLRLHGFQGNMDMDIDTVFPGQLGVSSNSASGIYRRPPSSSSFYTYDLGVTGGTASEQVPVPV